MIKCGRTWADCTDTVSLRGLALGFLEWLQETGPSLYWQRAGRLELFGRGRQCSHIQWQAELHVLTEA